MLLSKLKIKLLCIFILSLSFLFLLNQATSAIEKTETVPTITARSAVVIDAETGTILFEKQARVRLPMASLTKVMTALVAIEQVKNWDTTVSATPQACQAGESEIYLEPGEKISLKNLLYASLLKSANDATLLLSEQVAGNVNLFVAMMNRKAKELGMNDTHYQNSHGLTANNHFSSALDSANLAREALKYDFLREVFRTKNVNIPWESKKTVRSITNHNKLLHRYSFIKGIKTGYTRAAGNCLISYAEYGKRKVIAVVLNAPSSTDCYNDSLRLLEYGKSRLKEQKLIKKNQPVGTITLGNFPKREYRLIATSDIIAVAPENFKDFQFRITKFPGNAITKDGIAGLLFVYKRKNLAGATFLKLKPERKFNKEFSPNEKETKIWLDYLRKIL